MSPVTGAAAETGGRLEEQAAARSPQRVTVLRGQHPRRGHDGGDDRLLFRGQAGGREKPAVAQQREVAFVGPDRMRMRVRTQRDRAVDERLAQWLQRGPIEREIGQPVVGEPDPLAAQAQFAVDVGKLARIADHRAVAVALQQALEQHELGEQVLLLGPLVDDRDQLTGCAAALCAPLVQQRGDRRFLDARRRRRHAELRQAHVLAVRSAEPAPRSRSAGR